MSKTRELNICYMLAKLYNIGTSYVDNNCDKLQKNNETIIENKIKKSNLKCYKKI
jgi:hypothetical protein